MGCGSAVPVSSDVACRRPVHDALRREPFDVDFLAVDLFAVDFFVVDFFVRLSFPPSRFWVACEVREEVVPTFP